MKKLLFIVTIIIITGFSCDQTSESVVINTNQAGTITADTTPNYTIPTDEQIQELTTELKAGTDIPKDMLSQQSNEERYYTYGNLLTAQQDADYLLGFLEIQYDPDLDLTEVETKLQDKGFMVYNPFARTAESLQELSGGTPLFQNEVWIIKVDDVTIYSYDTCMAELDKFATDNAFPQTGTEYQRSLQGFIDVPKDASLEQLQALVKSGSYPCMNQFDWTIQETTNTDKNFFKRVFIPGEGSGWSLRPTDEENARVQVVLDELEKDPAFIDCELNDRGIGMALCSFQNTVGESEIIEKLQTAGIAEYKVNIWNFTGVLVPYNEEMEWSAVLSGWDEIESATPSAMLDFE